MSEKRFPKIVGTGDLRVGVAATTRRTRAPRKPTLAAALKAADKAGKPVASATITGSGVMLAFGSASANLADDDLDLWVMKHARPS